MKLCVTRSAEQHGGSLVVALTLLVAMSVAALALARMVSTDLLLAGNAAFREAAVLASDAGTEAAITWLTAQSSMTTADLLSDQPSLGYYASVPDGLLVTGAAATGTNITVGIDWDDDYCAGRGVARCVSAAPAMPLDGSGNSLRFVIHRMCRQAGASQAGGNSCLSWQPAQSAGGSRGQLGYGTALRLLPGERVYYRVTTRVRGPRNTTVFTQVLVHF